MQGLPLMTAAGVRMGEITDAYFDPSEQRILAFEVDWEENEAGLIGPDDLLPITQILELTADTMTVADELGVSAGLDSEAGTTQEGWVAVLATLIDKEASPMGTLVDLQFDPQDGSVHAYELAVDGQDDSVLVLPHAGIEIQDGQLVLSEQAVKAARETPRAKLDVAFLEDNGVDDTVGEDDLEVTRSRGAQPS